MRTVGVTYTCGGCSAIRRVVQVRERNVLQTAKHWMDTVMSPTLRNDHERFSPLCKNTKMKNVILPAAAGVGRGK